jgi:hypothetical protein
MPPETWLGRETQLQKYTVTLIGPVAFEETAGFQ